MKIKINLPKTFQEARVEGCKDPAVRYMGELALYTGVIKLLMDKNILKPEEIEEYASAVYDDIRSEIMKNAPEIEI